MSLTRKIACTIAGVGLIYAAYYFAIIGMAPEGGRVSGRFTMAAGVCGFLGLYLIYDAWGRRFVGR